MPRVCFKIAGTGIHVPPAVLDNQALVDSYGLATTPAWIFEKTGIQRRHQAAPGEATSDLAADAGRQALLAAGLAPADIDLIIVASVTPDFLIPTTASVVQAKLDCRRAVALDIPTGCPGFVFGLDMASRYLQDYKTVLLIGADVVSRIAAPDDRTTRALFGDGAGAFVLVGGGSGAGLVASSLHTAGDWQTLVIPSGAFADRDGTARHLHMDGRAVFSFAVEAFVTLVRELADQAGVEPSAFQAIVPHQANARIIEAAMAQLGLEADRAIVNIEAFGNTANASVPLAFHAAVNDGRIGRGDLVACVAFGSGLSWGGAALRF